MMLGWMPSVGSSSTSSLRLRHQRAGDRQLLLLPAGQIAAAPAQHGLQHGKQFEDIGRDAALAARQNGKAGLQVLPHRQQRKDVAPLRHPGDAAPRALDRWAGG